MLPPRISDTAGMIAGMAPALVDGVFCFCTFAESDPRLVDLRPNARAMFREDEGTSLILTRDDTLAAGLPDDQPMCQITLQVHSALDGVGLTAAVATALAGAGIACNVVAAFHHDHAFVPMADANAALAVLNDLTKGPNT